MQTQRQWIRYRQQINYKRHKQIRQGINININRVNNQGKGIKIAIGRNDNGKSKTRYSKIVNFTFNNIISHGYSI